jgi:hypothetical protein
MPQPDRMRFSLFLVLATMLSWGLFWSVGNLAESNFSSRGIQSRFPERDISYSLEQLSMLETTRDLAEFYVAPFVISPGSGRDDCACGIDRRRVDYWLGNTGKILPWIALILPAAYLVSDLLEDIMLAWILGGSLAIGREDGECAKGYYGNQASSIVATIGQAVLLLSLYSL